MLSTFAERLHKDKVANLLDYSICYLRLRIRLMSDDFLNMPKIFEPFQDSSGFFDRWCLKNFRKIPEALLMAVCFANNVVLDFGGLADSPP